MTVNIQNDILKLHAAGVLDRLLTDRTAKRNIVWATDAFGDRGVRYERGQQIASPLITGVNAYVIRTRAQEERERRAGRQRARAEVSTPMWVTGMMTDFADADWLDAEGRLLRPERWRDYVELRRLETACGEAPFLVNRYDVETGETIPVPRRSGILDRKLRVISESAKNQDQWLIWAARALQSTYGCEYQGDNLLTARVNVLMTFSEHLAERWGREPTAEEYKRMADIITWNLWQMDVLTGAVPPARDQEQESMFGDAPADTSQRCLVRDWRTNATPEFEDTGTREGVMRFDLIIGNPPYQRDTEGTSDDPIYHLFMDSACRHGDVAELIVPARFLFSAGKTPREWTRRMLNDEHLRVLFYEQDSSKIFAGTDIKGGVAVICRDSGRSFTERFAARGELGSILEKTKSADNLDRLVFAPESYKFTKRRFEDHPEIRSMRAQVHGRETTLLSRGHELDLTSNIFDKLYNIVFFDEPEPGEEHIRVLGRRGGERTRLYIKRGYVAPHPNLDKFKVFFPKANGAGKFGEAMAPSELGERGEGHTQTFISIGAFETRAEAENLRKYLKCRFTRALLYALKVTQDNKKSVWRRVPVQDFTPESDIDWSGPVGDIDRQLFEKYGLDGAEREFIESRVRAME